jgi:hypothetical protein
MQYHYVVGYDTELKKWFVDSEVDNYFRDGNVWDSEQSWFVPEENSSEEAFDYNLINTLGYIVDTFPIPQEV